MDYFNLNTLNYQTGIVSDDVTFCAGMHLNDNLCRTLATIQWY